MLDGEDPKRGECWRLADRRRAGRSACSEGAKPARVAVLSVERQHAIGEVGDPRPVFGRDSLFGLVQQSIDLALQTFAGHTRNQSPCSRRNSRSSALTCSGCSCCTQCPAPSMSWMPRNCVQARSRMRSRPPGVW